MSKNIGDLIKEKKLHLARDATGKPLPLREDTGELENGKNYKSFS